MIEYILMAGIIMNTLAIFFISQRIDIIHDRITRICKVNKIWGDFWK